MAWAPSWAPLGPFVEEIFWASNIWCVVKISAPFGLGRVMKLVGFCHPCRVLRWWAFVGFGGPCHGVKEIGFLLGSACPNRIVKCGFGIG